MGVKRYCEVCDTLVIKERVGEYFCPRCNEPKNNTDVITEYEKEFEIVMTDGKVHTRRREQVKDLWK